MKQKKGWSLFAFILAAMMLTACSGSGTAADTGKTEEPENETETVEETAEEETAEEETTDQNEASEDEGIYGKYIMRPEEIWHTTLEVFEEQGYTFMHYVSSSNDFYLYLEDGNAYGYSPEQNVRNADPDFTYVFEEGKVALTNKEQTSTYTFYKEGAE